MGRENSRICGIDIDIRRQDCAKAAFLRFWLRLTTEGPSYLVEGSGWTAGVMAINKLLGTDGNEALGFILKSLAAGAGATATSVGVSYGMNRAKRAVDQATVNRKGPTQLSYSCFSTFTANALWQGSYDITKYLLSRFLFRALAVGVTCGLTFFLTAFLGRIITHLNNWQGMKKSITKHTRDDIAGGVCALFCGAYFLLTNEGRLQTETTYTTEASGTYQIFMDLILSGLSTLLGYISSDAFLEILTYCFATSEHTNDPEEIEPLNQTAEA